MEPKFFEYVTNISNILGLNESEKKELLNIFGKFSEKFKLVKNTDELVQQLLIIDKEINKLASGNLSSYMERINKNWKEMNKNLAELQILSLISKKENCDKIISPLLENLTNKVSTVNKIMKTSLQEDIQSGEKKTSSSVLEQQKWNIEQPESAKIPKGQSDSNRLKNLVKKAQAKRGGSFFLKYLKYKKKYQSLKKNINL